MNFFPDMGRSADISEDSLYRYRLTRVWDDGEYALPFVMLNPSTADAERDDPTIGRCVEFARRDGWGGIVVANLYAFRASKPRDLFKARDPYGPRNCQTLLDIAGNAARDNVPIICAWGAHAGETEKRVALLRSFGAELQCLGRTFKGAPRHPLFVPADRPFELF